jgi:hypothetical protein
MLDRVVTMVPASATKGGAATLMPTTPIIIAVIKTASLVAITADVLLKSYPELEILQSLIIIWNISHL